MTAVAELDGQLALILDGQRLDDLPDQIRTKITINPTTGCWEWTGERSPDGYGKLRRGPSRSAHRAVYLLLVGPIPDDRPQLDHLCRVRPCVNPAHLEPVTNRENVLRAHSPNAIAHVTNRCAAGLHDLTGDNVRHRSDGRRQCKACADVAKRRWRADNIEAERARDRERYRRRAATPAEA